MAYKESSREEKDLAAKKQREWRAANPERWKKIIDPARKKWKRKYYDRFRQIQKNHRHNVRREILDLLGGQKCVYCGYDKNWRALQIDHINGGGRHDPKTRAGLTNLWTLRRWLKKNQEGARKKYQVLCANCNWIKRYENAEHAGELVRENA